MASGDPAVLGAVPVLADPVDRGAERALARFGLIASAPPVFTGCARAPLAGLLLALPALAATGLIEDAHATYGALPNGFYSGWIRCWCESVFRALLGQARAEGAARCRPARAGAGAGFGPGDRRSRRSAARSGCYAEAGRAGDWIAAMARRHTQDRPEQTAVLLRRRARAPTRAPAGSRKPMCPGLKLRPGHGGNLGVRRRGGSAAGGGWPNRPPRPLAEL